LLELPPLAAVGGRIDAAVGRPRDGDSEAEEVAVGIFRADERKREH
jgi:hypothetical protein